MRKIGEAFENAEQLLVPGPASDLHIAGATLRAEWSKPRQLVAALGCRPHREAAQRPHQMLRLAFAGLPRILPEPDRDPLTVPRGGIDQQLFDIAWVGALPHQIQQPIAAAPIRSEERRVGKE